MTTSLHKVLMGSCLALGLGLAAPASSEELRIGYISPVTGIFFSSSALNTAATI